MKSICILICLVFILPFTTEAADLIAIIVANTLPREENVGREYDVLKMVEEMETISEYTGLNLDLNLYIHEEYNHQLLSKLESLTVNSSDVLFFFYSGHGYRYNDKDPQKNPWPHLLIELEDKGVDHQTITEILEAKEPKLLFSLVSSCNKNLNRMIESLNPKLLSPKNFASVKSLPAEYSVDDSLSPIQENYRKLFLGTSGTIIASSSKPGQYSYRNRNAGTLYLDAFLSSLHELADGFEPPLWDSIFQRTFEKTVDSTKGKQTPQHALFLCED